MFGKCVLISLFFWGVVAFSAQDSVVITDGAMVYRKANFDAPVMAYLRAGTRLKISNLKFGEAFYRVRLRQGVLGYVADVDLQISDPNRKKPEPSREETKERPKSSERQRPPLARTYLGPVGGFTKYGEIINKTEYTDQIATYGLKFTTPFGLIGGPVLFDWEVRGSPAPPGYYSQLSDIPATGYFMVTSFQFFFPLLDFNNRRGFFYFGGGPMLAYSNFLVERNSSKLILEEIRAGATFTFGLGFDLGGSFVFKLEPKYHIEKASYNSWDVALQLRL